MKTADDYYEECINDPDSVNHQAALVVACNLLEEKDKEIAKLQENIEFRCDLARFAGYDEAYRRYAW